MGHMLKQVRDITIQSKDGSLTNLGFGLLMVTITVLFFLPLTLLF